MKIHWKQNPLCTEVELDDHDLDVLRLQIAIYEFDNAMAEIAVHAEEGKYFDLDRVRRAVVFSDSDSFWKEADRVKSWSVKALAEVHAGDCTCIPCSCSKCFAEERLGIRTIGGLGKHAANAIQTAFQERNSINSAISWLRSRESESSCDALEWLTRYRDQHFPA